MHVLANILGIFPEQWLIILVVALLLFGKRLPEVGKSLGKGIVEFKKGLAGIEDSINNSTDASASNVQSKPALPPAQPDYKFDPYTGQPIQTQAPASAPMRFDPYTGKPLSQQTSETSSNT